MPSFEDLYSFEHLYEAHCRARCGKQQREEVARFEQNLGCNLAQLSLELELGTYRLLPYTSFVVTDPKRREIHALHYRDRVVQHSLCDNIIAPVLEPRLVYDNAACRKGKGTLFALRRLEEFLREHYRRHGCEGWALRCDVTRYFASIRHDMVKALVSGLPFDERTRCFLDYIVDSYPHGLPLGNQTSQWFALYYLDTVDRLVKERMHVRAYVRYMDDLVLIHHSRGYLKVCLTSVKSNLAYLGLSLNGKTQIAPLSQGVDFLGWHFYLAENGRVVCRLRAAAKRRIRRHVRNLRGIQSEYAEKVKTSSLAYLTFGETGGLVHAMGYR